MENKDPDQKTIEYYYDYANNLLVNENMSPSEVKKRLMELGIDEERAVNILEDLEDERYDLKNKEANKDMLYGALWCVGGIILTAADFGYIFWGAIIFGGFQFVKGAMNS
jgi:hypothetical protein